MISSAFPDLENRNQRSKHIEISVALLLVEKNCFLWILRNHFIHAFSPLWWDFATIPPQSSKISWGAREWWHVCSVPILVQPLAERWSAPVRCPCRCWPPSCTVTLHHALPCLGPSTWIGRGVGPCCWEDWWCTCGSAWLLAGPCMTPARSCSQELCLTRSSWAEMCELGVFKWLTSANFPGGRQPEHCLPRSVPQQLKLVNALETQQAAWSYGFSLQVSAGIWDFATPSPVRKERAFGARTGRSREGTVLAGIAVTSGAHAGFVPWKSRVFPPFSNRRIFSSRCFWHCLTWRLWAGGVRCRALWELRRRGQLVL